MKGENQEVFANYPDWESAVVAAADVMVVGENAGGAMVVDDGDVKMLTLPKLKKMQKMMWLKM